MTVMRILLVADLHYALAQLDWVVGASPGFDLVVLAGDHLDIASTVPLEAQCVVIERYVDLVTAGAPVAISSGNHDLTGPDGAGEQCALWLDHVRRPMVLTDGDTAEIGSTLVTVCPWWDGDVGKQALDAQLEAAASRRRGRWVWVYHAPPTGSPTSWTGKRHYGDADLVSWIERHRPDVVLTGHVHQSPFRNDGGWADRIGDTWVFNAGRQIGGVPARIEIDLDAATAEWITMLGVESQSLTDLTAAPRELV
jgi:Icc-related predicted phosphoesterase